jgi:DnaJ-class molecular chaperone
MGKLLTKIEAATLLGVGVELVDWFVARCPKPKEKRKLMVAQVSEEAGQLFDQDEVTSFSQYLHEPWPKPPKGSRPHLPDEIKADIAKEAHLSCAICGLMVKCEVAHIESVADTLNNGPDNLIYLCPNHHTEYDYGFKPGSNVTIEEVQAAKRIKRNSRRRMMRFEENAAKVLHAVIKLAKSLEKDLKAEDNRVIREAAVTELKSLLTQVPELVAKAEAQAEKDQPADELTTAILDQAAQISKTALGISDSSTERDVRHSASQLSDLGADIEFDLDEVECPHCGGRGTTGLMGSYCSLCKGRTVVSEAESDAYSSDTYDEVECPHCHGRGTTGLVDDICAFCSGDCYVSREDADSYDPGDIDEVECPRCGGRGTTGLRQSFCAVCGGSCVVTKEEAADYDADDIDEVECPRCGGSGVKGFSNDYCGFCQGDCVVPRQKASEYDSDSLDEVECPHCHGSGRKGGSDYYCAVCDGAMVVSQKEADDYDPEEIDEVECPHCHGSGRIGDNYCKECSGACVVSSEEASEYESRRQDQVECPHCDGTGVKGLLGDLCNLCRGNKVIAPDVYDAYRDKYG